MKTNPNDPKWTAYVLNEVSDTERQELEAELAENPGAREAVEELRDLCGLLSDSFAKDPDLSLDPLQKERIHQAARKKPSRGLSQWRLPLVAAATVVIGLLGYQVTVLLSPPPMPMQDGYSVQVIESEPQASSGGGEIPAEEMEAEEMEEDFYHMYSLDISDKTKDGHTPLSNVMRDVPQEDVNVPAPRRLDVESLSELMSDVASPVVMTGLSAGRSETERGAARTSMLVTQDSFLVQDDLTGARSVISPSLDDFDVIRPNAFRRVADHPLSTFSIDVDTASYSIVRKYLKEGRLPPRDAVRIEEMINYFPYDAVAPEDGEAFAATMEMAPAPWKPEHHLLRIAIKGREIPSEERPPLNLVFLLDVSGSMNSSNKLPLVKRSMTALAQQLDARDRVAIVVYASASGMVLPTTVGSNTHQIVAALDRLQSGGGTAGGAGIQLAYDTARKQFREGGVNRVILCTDGDFNVGIHQRGDLERLIEQEAATGVQLSVLGFGMGNYKDSTLELLSNKGDGNYAYIDDFTEARKVLVDQLLGTMVTIARDVKIQVEFNPARVAGYRLIGYENRMLKKEDFNNDQVDAGDIGAGHQVTAFYELVPRGESVSGEVPEVDELKYQAAAEADRKESGEWLTLK
ncbi:MAG: von Willebrand factor type A domain-containing protein, partial [Kiritimatiellae bacterium]|nr:von Willebrand factor type A domain-containing protein [Kiritimatiellia bacterium]